MKTLKYQLIAIFSLAFCFAQAQSPTVGEVLTASDGTTGVVFYVSPDGNTFWLAAMNDLPGTYQWGPIGDVAGLENYESANDAISLFAVSATSACVTIGDDILSVIAITPAPVFDAYSVALTTPVV